MNLEEIKELIKRDINNKKTTYNARTYYYNTNKRIEEKTILVGDEIKLISNKNKIKINYLKQLITQKIDYILSKEITVNNNLFIWDEIFSQMIKNASLDIISWINFYIKDGVLNYIIVEDREIIPIFDNTNNLIELIRYYQINEVIRIEYWTKNNVKYFEIKEDNIKLIEETYHYKEIITYNDEIENIEYKNFKTIPFIPLFNNRNMEDDAEDIYILLDMYDSICSGFIDNINNFQEAIVKLKNFSGDSEQLKEALKLMKETKAVGIPSDGDIEYLKVEIPVEARQVILSLIKDAIYSLGRGVDVDKLISANNITNVYIKSRYQSLDFKANDTILQCKIFYKKVIEFVNGFLNKNLSNKIEFNKTLIVNESEQIDTVIKAINLIDEGILSKETLMKNIPWISNIKQELKQIEIEKGQQSNTNI